MNKVINFRASLICLITIGLFTQSCNHTQTNEMQTQLSKLIKKHVDTTSVLRKQSAIANFDASISGKDEDYKKAADLQIILQKIYTNKDDFNQLKKWKESGQITDTLLKRQLDLLFLSYQGNQADPQKLEEIIKVQNEIENKFSKFRVEIQGKKYSDNEIDSILNTSVKTEELKTVWLASKKIAPVVAQDVVKLVKMRNSIAKELGYDNFHEMSLKLDEQDPNQIESLFDELDLLTKEAFAKEKNNIDEYFAKKYGVKKSDLMPWHYQNRFFQEAPGIYDIDLDGYYSTRDVVALTSDYFAGIGLPIDKILEKSDLYEKDGKYQHAYCTDIDKEGDVRVVCNVRNNEYWMNTMLHEYGHAIYDYYMDRNTPYLLRDPAHTFTTEAIAELFGRFATNAKWLQDVVGISEQEAKKIENNTFSSLRLQMLVFSRWAQVMYRFEKSMYANPDQDLNKLWWDLVEKYQLLKRPADRNEPDWASKIHIATVPCYYHNYLLGELLASQIHAYICKNILKTDDLRNQSYVGNVEIGKFFKDKIFAPARIFYWNDMIKMATGEKLTAKYYAKQFVE